VSEREVGVREERSCKVEVEEWDIYDSRGQILALAFTSLSLAAAEITRHTQDSQLGTHKKVNSAHIRQSGQILAFAFT